MSNPVQRSRVAGALALGGGLSLVGALFAACGGGDTAGAGAGMASTTSSGAGGTGAAGASGASMSGGNGAGGGSTSTGGGTGGAGGSGTSSGTGGLVDGGADAMACSEPFCSAECGYSGCQCPENGPIAGYAEHDGLRAIEASNFVLRDAGTWAAAGAHFDGLGLPYVPVEALPLNRTGTKPAGALLTFLQGMVDYAGGFEWESGDQSVSYWIPQGLTGGAAGGKQMVAVSWHYDETKVADDANPPVVGDDKGSRLSFADVTAVGGDIPYRHVLFVQADAAAGFASVNIHVGGLAWVGPYLYVADTGKGVRVFDLTRIMKVSAAAECASQIGLVGGQYCAYGYGYALPQVGAFNFPAGLGASCKARFSFLSVDTTSSPPSLISGEYDNDVTTGIYSRLLRWPLNEATSRLDTTPGGDVFATGAWYAGNRNLQGATAVDGKFFLDSTRYNGALFTGAVDQGSKVYKATSGKWGYMAEGIHHTPAGKLWIVTEGHPSMPRIVFSAMAANIP